MEITCQQCSTAFSVDMVAAPGAEFEVVCPNCFQLHKVIVPIQRPVMGGGLAPAVDPQRSPLGDGGVADRLRDGFTLTFEVRHSTWVSPRKLNLFEIKRLIYQGELDGTEEFRENLGRWFHIGEHPELARVFQLKGRPVKTAAIDRGDSSAARFGGWRTEAAPAAQAVPEEAPEVVEPEPKPADRRRVWMMVAGAGIAVAAVVAAVILL